MVWMLQIRPAEITQSLALRRDSRLVRWTLSLRLQEGKNGLPFVLVNASKWNLFK